MSVFAYVALGKDGRKTSGTLTSDSRAAALAQMTRDGLHPVSIQEARNSAAAQKKAQAAVSGAARVGRVPAKAVESFTRELANLLAGGVPLSRSLALLRREASNPAAKHLWGQVHDDVVGGTALAEALAKWPKSFSTVYVAMVRAGEAGGFLDVVLGQIADFRVREQDLKGKVKAAMVYPAILAILAVGVVTFLMTYFIPSFKGIFAQFGANLPTLTLFIISCSNIVQRYWLGVLAVVIISAVAIRRTLATSAGRRKLEVIMLSTPVLGQIMAHFALVRFSRMLGTLAGAGVPLVAGLKVAREAIGNQTLSDTVAHAIEEVQRGQPLSKSLAGDNRLFPASVVEMVAIAEETGRLDKELLRMAITYESDLDRQLRLLVSIVEPAMLFIMAGLIGTIVVGMLLPVLNLQDIVK
ncbi:MAG: type II secretion system F family protein [Planctomycetota bacterium]|nr:type II secretion system F family protein [Planctomycetota bacterium]